MEAGAAVEDSLTGTVAVRTVFVTGAAGTGDPGAVPTEAASGLGEVAALGGEGAGLGGAGLSGLMPPSQAGPEYMSAVKPFVFHFSSKSAAALLGVSPTPVTSFQG
ncbi:MAG: hypothetical protein KF722_15855 [Nitrospira sp.]|nr:hypothetical protein [Nitrospira sp.]